MLIPLVAAGVTPNDAETIAKLSVLSHVVTQLPRATLELLVEADKSNLTESEAALKHALLDSRTITGPFAADMMATAISWLDQGVRKVLVDAESSEDSELARVATAISELPANRVVLGVPVDVETLADSARALEIQQKIQRLNETIGGVILSLRLSSLQFENDVAFDTLAASLKKIRSGFDEGYFFAVQLDSTTDASANIVSRIASLHTMGIQVVAAALPRVDSAATAEQRLAFVDAGVAFVKCIRTDRTDSLITTVVADEAGVALGLVYSSDESILSAIESGRGVYYSRSRKGLWKKGESSGNFQELVRLDVDCDSDALRFTVRQTGAGFCHLNTRTCWGESGGLQHLEEMLTSRLREAPEGSYTKRLFNDPVLLRNKLVEEAQELAEAETREDVAGEAADVMYFAMVRCIAAGATLTDVERVLDMRALKVKRRPGNSKAYRIDAANEILTKQQQQQ